MGEKEAYIVSCTALEDTVVNMVKHDTKDIIAVQLFTGELFQLVDGILEPWGSTDIKVRAIIHLTKTTSAQNEIALSYHRVRGLYFLAVVFVSTIFLWVSFSIINVS